MTLRHNSSPYGDYLCNLTTVSSDFLIASLNAISPNLEGLTWGGKHATLVTEIQSFKYYIFIYVHLYETL